MDNSQILIIENIKSDVKSFLSDDFSGHDYLHVCRVHNYASHLQSVYGGDLFVISLLCLLHDVDDRKLVGKQNVPFENAKKFLNENNVSEENIEKICNIISQVSFKGNGTKTPDTLEGKCVQDADRLDAIGAIGIARTFAYGGNHNRLIYDPNIKPILNMDYNQYKNANNPTINHFYEKLFKLKDLMNTDTAKNIAQHREMYMKAYISEFMDEWEGIA